MTTVNVLTKLSMATAGAAVIALGVTGNAQAAQIGSSAFGSGAVVESFEGLTAGSNINNPFSGYLVPGTSSSFTFASGVTLTAPIPNDFSKVLVGDWSIGDAGFGLANNGSIGSSSDIPDGTAYLGYNSDSSAGSVEFTFASDILRVGGFVTSAFSGGTITLSAFDALDNLLETVSNSNVNVTNWGSNFLGLENSGGIRKIKFNGDYTVLDKLTFEAASKSVPEPASLMGILGLGAFGVTSLRKRKQATTVKA